MDDDEDRVLVINHPRDDDDVDDGDRGVVEDEDEDEHDMGEGGATDGTNRSTEMTEEISPDEEDSGRDGEESA